MNSSVPIVVHGAAGRMGQAVLRLALDDADVRVAGAVVRPDSALAGALLRDSFGERAGALAYAPSLDGLPSAAVVIDFSAPSAFDAALAWALGKRVAFVSGTTGLSAQQVAALRGAATTIAVLWSANFSVGVAVLTRLAREAARALKGWDCEIAEAHHRHKKDAPSGTALALGRAVAEARGDDFERVAVLNRVGANAARDASTIGFAATRAGDIVGEHTIVFAGAGERLELTHRATDRDVFARGALRAAFRMAGRPPGLYTMADVIDAG